MAAFEHEHRFLVSTDAWRDEIAKSEAIKQAYVADLNGGVLRVRLIGDIGYLSLKCRINRTTSREFEYTIPQEDAIEIMALPGVIGTIEKTRHTLYSGWEIDEFHANNNGLIIAEIELDEAGELYERPEWLGMEVTDDPHYSNRHLSVNGNPI